MSSPEKQKKSKSREPKTVEKEKLIEGKQKYNDFVKALPVSAFMYPVIENFAQINNKIKYNENRSSLARSRINELNKNF